MGERERDRSGSASPINDSASTSGRTPSISTASVSSTAPHSIDALLDRSQDGSEWEPVRPPEPLGELLDSRYMLPLLLPTDPRLLSASPAKSPMTGHFKQERRPSTSLGAEKKSIMSPDRGALAWRSRNRKVREVDVGILQWVDGVRSAARWRNSVEFEDDQDDSDGQDDEADQPSYASDEPHPFDEELKLNTHITPLTRKPSGRTKGRQSMGETTPIA